jgi:multiple sugar transport system ATP-binding protein
VLVHFPIDAAQPLTEEVIELAADVDEEAVGRVHETADVRRSIVIARLNPRTRANQGDSIDLVVDTHRLHFFDPGTGLGIYGSDH